MTYINTIRSTFKLAGTADSTATSFPTRTPGTAEPSGFDPDKNDVQIVPFALGADNRTLSMRVIGWSRAVGSGTHLWTPVVINQFDLTLGGATGVAGTPVGAGYRFADTITASTTVVGDSVYRKSSPGSDLIGGVVVSTDAFERIEITFSGTSANALYAEL